MQGLDAASRTIDQMNKQLDIEKMEEIQEKLEDQK